MMSNVDEKYLFAVSDDEDDARGDQGDERDERGETEGG